MEQVDVPAGLDARILAALAQQSSPGGALAGVVDKAQNARPDARAELAPAPVPAAWSRRRWLAGASVVAASLLVALFASQYFRAPSEQSPDELADIWLSSLSADWKKMDGAPRDFMLPVSLTVAPIGWQRFSSGGARGVAFKLARANVGNALLMVAKLSRPSAPTLPPPHPQSTTGGKSIGYWRSGQLLYVLVVEGSEREYRSFVNAAGSPVA
jgi:hypothetical protein